MGKWDLGESVRVDQTFTKKLPVDVSAPQRPAMVNNGRGTACGLVEFWAPDNFQTTVQQTRKKSL